jgi:outer membrane protein assembly factor BamE
VLFRSRDVEAQNYRLTLLFQGDALERFEGDEMPSETEFVERISRKRELTMPALEATEEQLAQFSPAAEADAPHAAASAPAAPAGGYPPLEPQ